MTVKEVQPDKAVTERLIALSEDWEKENSCHGYRKNSEDYIRGNRIFLAVVDRNDNDDIIGYLLGHKETAKRTTSIYKEGTVCFEIEEIYVKPDFRSRGIGGELFRYAEKEVSEEADVIILSTATKNFRAILHFYIDELGMDFWNARLFKRIR